MREIVSVRMNRAGSWRVQLSCGHEDEAIYSTRAGGFRFCAFCKMAANFKARTRAQDFDNRRGYHADVEANPADA